MKIKVDNSSKSIDIVEIKHGGNSFKLQKYTDRIPSDTEKTEAPNVCRIVISDMGEIYNLLCAFEEMKRQLVQTIPNYRFIGINNDPLGW